MKDKKMAVPDRGIDSIKMIVDLLYHFNRVGTVIRYRHLFVLHFSDPHPPVIIGRILF